MKDLNVRLDTIKFLEADIGRTLSGINPSKIFFDPSLKSMKIKTKVNKWDPIKLQTFCTEKEIINKMRRHSSEWEKIFANEVIRDLSPKYINIHTAQFQRNKQPNQKMGRRCQ